MMDMKEREAESSGVYPHNLVMAPWYAFFKDLGA